MRKQPPEITFQEGRYTVTSQLGAGGVATVWGIFDNKLETEKAMKVLELQVGSSPMTTLQSADVIGSERFEKEAKLMSRLNHPNIITIHDYFSDTQNLFIIMEKCRGSLDAWVHANGPMPFELAVQVTISILNGLDYAHEKEIVHRDIKPHNVLISEAGTIKIGDFGLAHDNYASNVYTKTNALMGSIQFMSPEQRVDVKRIDHRSDIYSVAMTLVWLLEGQTCGDIYVQEVLDDLSTRYSTELVAIIAKAGKRSASNRYATAKDMAIALEELNIAATANQPLLFGLELKEIPLTDLVSNQSMTSIREKTVQNTSQTSQFSSVELPQPSKGTLWLIGLSIGTMLLLLLGIAGILLFDRESQSKNSFTNTSINNEQLTINSEVKTLEPTFKQCDTFIQQTQSSFQIGPRETHNMIITDANKDGYQDAAFMNLMDKSISLYLGDGKSMIDDLSAIEIPTLRSFAAPLFGDINNDGIMDIVGLHQDGSRISINKGLGDNAFRSLEIYGRDEMLQEPPPKNGTLADYDQDGLIDLLFISPSQNGDYRLLSRRNAGKGLDYQIQDLPGVQEEPFEWHKMLGTFKKEIRFHPTEPTFYWIENGTLFEQGVSETGLLTQKRTIETELGDLEVLQVIKTPNNLQWIMKGPARNMVLLEENKAPCTFLEDLHEIKPLNKQNTLSFGYWNSDNKLDLITSNTCIYCTSNHILHITQ